MNAVSKKPKPTKGQRRREEILRQALDLFKSQGYEATSLRQISDRSGCSLGLTYRYFASKEEILFNFFEQTAFDFATQLGGQKKAGLGKNFRKVMEQRIETLAPYRGLFSNLLPAMSKPDSATSVFGPKSQAVRATVMASLELVVQRDTFLKRPQISEMAVVLFHLHLVVLFVWVHDGEAGHTTQRILRLLEKAIGWTVGSLQLGFGKSLLADWAAIGESLIKRDEK